MGSRSILALELCMHYEANLHAHLRQAITQGTQSLAYGEKWQLYSRTTWQLVQHKHLWVSGCWDFFDEDMKARSDFNMWVQGMLTEEGARTAPHGQNFNYRDPAVGNELFMTFTMAALMVSQTPSERAVAAACSISEARLWQRSTFEHVLRSTHHLNFAAVEASTMYLIPRDPEWGLTTEDLKHPKFHYLRPIV